MTAPQGGSQVPLCASSKQQEVVHALIVCSQLLISELHSDNTMTLQWKLDRKRKEEYNIMKEARKTTGISHINWNLHIFLS